MPEKQSPASSLFRFSFLEDLFSCLWSGQGTGTGAHTLAWAELPSCKNPPAGFLPEGFVII